MSGPPPPPAHGTLVAQASDDSTMNRSLTSGRRGEPFNGASGHLPPTMAGWPRQVGQDTLNPNPWFHGGPGMPQQFRPPPLRQSHPPHMPLYATGQAVGDQRQPPLGHDHDRGAYGRLNIRPGQQQTQEALHMNDDNYYPTYPGPSPLGSWQPPSGWHQPDPSPRSAAGEPPRATDATQFPHKPSRERAGVPPSQAYQPSIERLHQIQEQDDAPLQRVTTSPGFA